jgi:hypothetical protein
MIHHTGDDSNSVAVIKNGRKDLKGPLSQTFGYRNKGRAIHIIAAGYCNHAGINAKASITELNDGDVDQASTIKPGADTAGFSGNRYLIGCEFAAKGAFTDDQYYTALALAVAVSVASGAYKDPDSDGKRINTIAHKEATKRKPDPIFDMAKFRKEAEAMLDEYLAKDAPQKPAEPPAEPVPAPAPASPPAGDSEAPTGGSSPYFSPALAVDGVWGKKTTNALRRTIRGKYKSIGLDGQQLAVEGAPGEVVNRHLYAAMQRAFNTAAYRRGWYARLVVDGVFGKESKKAWQRLVGVAVTGDFDKASIKALQKALNENEV